MSCKAIKFEEITVISHAKNPKVLVMARTERAEIRMGKRTHLIRLKTTHKIKIKINIKVDP